MRLGIMQPYFFPYLGHFHLIKNVDQWIVFDITQYTPKSWLSRNRILHPNTGWQYVNVALSNSSRSIKIHEAQVHSLEKTRLLTLGKLTHYKKKAPFYDAVINVVNNTFNSTRSDRLVDLNYSSLEQVCEYLEIEFNAQICSDLDLTYPANPTAGDWAPLICHQLEANEYLNPIAGQALFDLATFNNLGIKLLFSDMSLPEYAVNGYKYESGLSILDVMMWCSPSEIHQMLATGRMVSA